MSLRRRLFGIGKRLLNNLAKAIQDGFDLYLPDWNAILGTGTLNTANQVNFVAANLSIGTLQERITLNDSWYVEFSKSYVNGSTILGSSDGATYISYQNTGVNGVRVRTTGSTDLTYGGAVISENDVTKIVLDNSVLYLYLNGLLVDSATVIGDNLINIDYVNNRRGDIYGSGIQRYLDINGIPFQFTEGVGNKLYSSRLPLVRVMLAGQSNANSENSLVDGNPDNLPSTFPTSYEYNSSGVRTNMTYDVNAFTGTSNGYGIEFRITNDIQETGRNLEWLKYAYGNTSIGVNSDPFGGWWNQVNGTGTLGFIAAAVASGVQLDYLVWLQGENDATNLTDANAYETNLTALFAKFRAEINADLKIIVVKLFDFPSAGQLYPSTIQAAQEAVVAADSNAWILDPATDAGVVLADILPDDIHFNTVGIDKIGIAAASLLQTIGFNTVSEGFEIDLVNHTWTTGVDTPTRIIGTEPAIYGRLFTGSGNYMQKPDITHGPYVDKTVIIRGIYFDSDETGMLVEDGWGPSNGALGLATGNFANGSTVNHMAFKIRSDDGLINHTYLIIPADHNLTTGDAYELIVYIENSEDASVETVTFNGTPLVTGSSNSPNPWGGTGANITFGRTDYSAADFGIGGIYYVDFGGTVYEESNNWQGATKYGDLPLVESKDGGQTWLASNGVGPEINRLVFNETVGQYGAVASEVTLVGDCYVEIESVFDNVQRIIGEDGASYFSLQSAAGVLVFVWRIGTTVVNLDTGINTNFFTDGSTHTFRWIRTGTVFSCEVDGVTYTDVNPLPLDDVQIIYLARQGGSTYERLKFVSFDINGQHKYTVQPDTTTTIFDEIGNNDMTIFGDPVREASFDGMNTWSNYIIPTWTDIITQTALMSWNKYQNPPVLPDNIGLLVIPEDKSNLGFDVLGEAIERPYLPDGLNFTGQELHHYDSGVVVDRSAKGLIGLEFNTALLNRAIPVSSWSIGVSEFIEFRTFGTFSSTIYIMGTNVGNTAQNHLSLSSVSGQQVKWKIGAVVVDFDTAGVSPSGKLCRLERDGLGNATLTMDGGAPIAGSSVTTGNFLPNQVGMRGDTLGGTEALTYLNINDENMYLFNERERLTVEDQIGTNDLTLTSLYDDGSPIIEVRDFDGIDDRFVVPNQSILNKTFRIQLYLESIAEQQIIAIGDGVATPLDHSINMTINSTFNGLNNFVVSRRLNNNIPPSSESLVVNGITPTVGVLYDIIVTTDGVGNPATLSVNGVAGIPSAAGISRLIDGGKTPVEGSAFMTRLNVDENFPTEGKVIQIEVGATVSNEANNWAGGTIEGAVPLVSYDNAVNWLNASITREETYPQWKRSDNSTTWIADDGNSVGGSTDAFFIRRRDFNTTMAIAGDDVAIFSTLLAKLNSEFNSLSLTTTEDISRLEWVYIAFVTDGFGLGSIYLGTDTTASYRALTGLTGVAVSAIQNMFLGNDNATGDSYNGYLTQYVHFPRQIFSGGIELIRIIGAGVTIQNNTNLLVDDLGNTLVDDLGNNLIEII